MMEQRTKILILKHDANDLELLEFALQQGELPPCKTEVVQTRKAYEEALLHFAPDVIVSDYVLPGFDGLLAFRMKQVVLPRVPFIMITGCIGEEHAVDLIKMGVSDIVIKERLNQLPSKIRRALKVADDCHPKGEARQQLQMIMDLSLDVICILDKEGRFVTVSAAARQTWGYSPQDLIGTSVLELVHPDDKAKTRQAMAGLGQNPELVNFETRFIDKSKAVIPLLWSVRWDARQQHSYCVARNATNLKQAEEKLKLNEKRFRTLLQYSTDGFTLVAADGTILERSDSGLRITGFEPIYQEEGNGAAKLRFDLVHPDDRPAAIEAFDQVRQNPGSSFTLNYRLWVTESTFKWIEITFHNCLHEPVVGAIVLNYRDITEKKLAELAIRKSEARLKQAQAIGQMGSWEVNLVDGSIAWSDEMYRLLGVSKNAITPSVETFMTFVHPDDRQAVIQNWEQAVATLENSAMSYRIVRPDGQVRYMNGIGHSEFDEQGNPLHFFGIVQDITDIRLAQVALVKSEQKYRNLFNLSPIPMWVYDVDTLKFLHVNEAAVAHYGYSREEFLQMTLWDLRSPEEYEKLEQAAKIIRENASLFQDIFRHKKKNGEIIDMDVTTNIVDVGDKKVRAVIAIDISERIRYMRAIEAQNARLREIAWVQSHVVRAPLARLMGLINLLNEEAATRGVKPDLLILITEAANELDHIIRDIVRRSEQVKDQS